jgi:hypothetical protein
MEQGSNTTILLNLNVTHLIHIGQTGPALAFPGMTCLTVNWSESLKGKHYICARPFLIEIGAHKINTLTI